MSDDEVRLDQVTDRFLEEMGWRGREINDDLRSNLTERLTHAFEHVEISQETYEQRIRDMYGNIFRRFVLDRNVDPTGVSGTGVVAEGVEFSDGVVAVRWRGAWPTSVVFHDHGLDSVLRIHGHDGRTVVRFLDGPTAGVPHDHNHGDKEHTHDHGHEIHDHEHGHQDANGILVSHRHEHVHEGDHAHRH